MEAANWLTLIATWAAAWSLCMEIVVRAIDEPSVERGELLRRADRIVAKPPNLILGEPRLWNAFLRLRGFAGVLSMEVGLRLVSMPTAARIAPALVDPNVPPVWLRRLHQAIRTDYIAVRPSPAEPADRELADEASDFQQIATAGLLKAYRSLGEMYAAQVPWPLQLDSRRRLGLAALPDRGWNWDYLFHRNKIVRAIMAFGPLEQAETLRLSAHQALRDHWEQRDARTRNPAGGFRDVDNLIEAALDGRVLNPRGATILNRDGATAGRPTPETETARIEAATRKRDSIISTMRDQYGDKAVVVAEQLLAGKSVREAAASAEVSRQMADRYRIRLLQVAESLRN